MTGHELAAWSSVHAGDVVLGHDGQEWGVAEVDREAGPVGVVRIRLVRHGDEVTGWPGWIDPVPVVRRSDTAPEAVAAAVLIDRLGPVEIIRETWE